MQSFPRKRTESSIQPNPAVKPNSPCGGQGLDLTQFGHKVQTLRCDSCTVTRATGNADTQPSGQRTSGRTDGRTSGQADRWASGRADKWTGRQADRRIGGWVEKRTSGQGDRRIRGQAAKRPSGRADKRINRCSSAQTGGRAGEQRVGTARQDWTSTKVSNDWLREQMEELEHVKTGEGQGSWTRRR